MEEMTSAEKDQMIRDLQASREMGKKQEKELRRRVGELSSRNSVLEEGARLSQENQEIREEVNRDKKGKKKDEKVEDLVKTDEVIKQLLGILQNISEGKFWGEGGCHDFKDLKEFIARKVDELKTRLPDPL